MTLLHDNPYHLLKVVSNPKYHLMKKIHHYQVYLQGETRPPIEATLRFPAVKAERLPGQI